MLVTVSTGGLPYLLGGGSGSVGLSSLVLGQPTIQAQVKNDGLAYVWWNSLSMSRSAATNPVTVGGAFVGYHQGIYPWTATGGGCLRPPSGIITEGWSANPTINMIDPGFQCVSLPTLNPAMIPEFGAQQATGAGGSGTTCAPSTPGSGYFTLTTTTAINHGIQPGGQFTLSGMGGTGTSLNVTYVAAAGSTGTTLVGVSNSASTCPTGITEGLVSPGTSAANGLGGTFAFTGTLNGSTGISMGPGQRFCGIVGEYGATR